MSDVFISYSRSDEKFAGQLREALISQAQDIWIDWESIPPSQAWWDEIKKGIAKANNFVVILSPHSMASPICQMEIEYARELEKRIIPVLHLPYEREAALIEITKRLAKKEETTTREIWGNRQPHDLFDANDAELKRINYFFFRQTDDFQTRFEALFQIIRTDFVHKEQHTTLQQRAIEWNRRGRDTSFLLLDTELEQAEAWLEQAVDKEPPPTDLHREYIRVSRQADQRRRRLVRSAQLSIVVLVLVLIAGLMIGASIVNQTQQEAADIRATSAQDVAQAETRAADANGQLTAVPPTLTQVGEQVITAQGQADAAATQVADANRQLATATQALVTATHVAAQAVADQATAAQNVALAETQAAAAIAREAAANSEVAVAGATLSPIPLTLEAFTDQIEAARLETLARNENLPDTGNIETGVLLAIQSINVYPSETSRNSLQDMLTMLYTLHRIPAETCGVTGGNTISFSPDGQYIAFSTTDGLIHVWDTITHEEVTNFSSGTSFCQLTGLTFSPDGKFILFATEFDETILWNIETSTIEKRYPTAALKATFSYSGEYILASTRENRAKMWEVDTGTLVREFVVDDDMYTAVFSPDDKYVLTSGDYTVRLWDSLTGENIYTISGLEGGVLEPYGVAGIYGIAFSPDGQYVFVGGEQSVLIEAKTGNPIRNYLGLDDGTSAIAFSPNSQYVATAYFNGLAILWDVATGRRIRTLSGHTSSVNDIAFSPNGKFVVTSTYDEIRLWDSDLNSTQPSPEFLSMDNDELISYACDRVFRELTESEKEQFNLEGRPPTCPKFNSP